ncbi:MAG: hypothetical protein NXH86_04055 [Flavobacteriaceae bacterium]|uniref:hypothetical protein n=1 Tax=Flagellimonas sp. SN16 TaxID=3415142 RepID=UPI003C688788|nr:hypothetical protein [Flavobacteriaceae bacterium]
MPVEEVKDMTWADFQLRSFQYWEDRKHEMRLVREVAYMGYCNLFAWSKEKPKSKDAFWKIDENESTIDEVKIEAFKAALEEYNKVKK